MATTSSAALPSGGTPPAGGKRSLMFLVFVCAILVLACSFAAGIWIHREAGRGMQIIAAPSVPKVAGESTGAPRQAASLLAEDMRDWFRSLSVVVGTSGITVAGALG